MGTPGKGRSRQESRDHTHLPMLTAYIRNALEYVHSTMKRPYAALQQYRPLAAPRWVTPSATRMATRRYVARRPPPRQPRVSRGVSGNAPLGVSKTIRMKYFDNIQINPSLATAGDYVFSANGVYDPNITGTGHQPYAFDTMMTLYNHCFVTASTIRVQMWNNQSNIPIIMLVQLMDSATTKTGEIASVLCEQPRTVYKLTPTGVGGNVTTLRAKFNARDFFHHDVTGDDNYRNTISGNPTEQAYWHVILCPQWSSDDPVQNTLLVEIEYTATFTEPKILSQS